MGNPITSTVSLSRQKSKSSVSTAKAGAYSLDHLVCAQTRTFLIGLLLAVIPDIGRELPVASDLLPHHEIFTGDFLRCRTLGLEAEDPDLARRGGPKWLDIKGCEF